MINPITDPDGNKEWYNSKGQLHREDGPARELANGISKAWYINGNLHREDGAAIEWYGKKSWWINGKKIK